MRRSTFITALALLISSGLGAATPDTGAQKLISTLSRREPLRSGVWGVLAVRMNGDTLACSNHLQKMVPASNVKLITTGLALNVLGPDYRFETTLAHTGEIRGGVLCGDLYIVGGGDPTTGSKSDCAEPLQSLFQRWTEILRSSGISRIEGRVIGDPRYFDIPQESLGWTFDDLGTNYGIGPSGLNFFENAQNFYVTPGPAVGTRPFVMTRYPDTPWMTFTNMASTSGPRTPNDIYLVNTTFGPYGEFRGHFPIDRKGYTMECSNRFGAYTCAYYFFNHLIGNGVEVTGGYGDIAPQGHVRTDLLFSNAGQKAASRQDLHSLGKTLSPALRDIARDTNWESDNFYAETMLHTLGIHAGTKADYDSCLVVAGAQLRRLGVNTDQGFRLFDGSGLSRKNYIAPDFFVRYLKAMTRSGAYADFKASMPQPGCKGTLETRMRSTPDEIRSRIHMKSGSMNGVVCFSGYIDAPDGDPSRMVVFSVMTNNTTGSAITVYHLLEDIILAIAAE